MALNTIWHQHDKGVFTIERKADMADIEAIVAANKRSFNDTTRHGEVGFGRRVASIPNVEVEKWMKMGINIFDYGKCPDTTRKVKQLLNSPEYRWLRTHNSRI